MASAVTVSIRTGRAMSQFFSISSQQAFARSRARWVLMGSCFCRVMVFKSGSRMVTCTAPAQTPCRRSRPATSSASTFSAERISAGPLMLRRKVEPLPTLLMGSFSPQRRTGASSSPRA